MIIMKIDDFSDRQIKVRQCNATEQKRYSTDWGAVRFAHCASTFFSGPWVISLEYDHFYADCDQVTQWSSGRVADFKFKGLWFESWWGISLKILKSEIYKKDSSKMMKLVGSQ